MSSNKNGQLPSEKAEENNKLTNKLDTEILEIANGQNPYQENFTGQNKRLLFTKFKPEYYSEDQFLLTDTGFQGYTNYRKMCCFKKH